MDEGGSPNADDWQTCARGTSSDAQLSAEAAAAATLDALPSLVWDEIWHRLSVAGRLSLRQASKGLRACVDEHVRRLCTAQQDNPEALHGVLAAPAWWQGRGHRRGRSSSTDTGSGGTPGTPACATITSHASDTTSSTGSSTSSSSTSGSACLQGRYTQLRALTLTPHAQAAPSRCATAPLCAPGAFAAPYLQPFLAPSPSTLLRPFLHASHLQELTLLDVAPSLSEHDLRTLAASFPALRALHLLVSPACGWRAVALPQLGPLRSCEKLRELSVDLGRGGVLGRAARSSLGQLTQLTRLLLAVTDAGAGEPMHHEVVCCGAGGLAAVQAAAGGHVSSGAAAGAAAAGPSGAAGGEGAGAQGRGGAAGACGGNARGVQLLHVVAVGGLQASLCQLAAAGLRSLELRFVSFSAPERALLLAAAAGAAAAPDPAPAGASAPGAAGTDPSAGDPHAATTPGARAACPPPVPRGRGLQHLCVRLIPPAPPAGSSSSSSSSSGATAGSCGSGSGGLSLSHSAPPYAGSSAFLGSGTHWADSPLASLSFGPHPHSAGGPGGAATAPAWLQPSESESLLGCLAALPGLTSIEVPHLLLASGQHLHARLAAWPHLRHLRLGGVVAAGVAPHPPPAPGGAHAPGLPAAGHNSSGTSSSSSSSTSSSTDGGCRVPRGLTSLVVEAEVPHYGGGSSAPWWSTHAALHRLSLTLQYGSGSLLDGPAGRRSDGTVGALAAALARVPCLRLVLSARSHASVGHWGALAGGGFCGCGCAAGPLALGRELPVLLDALCTPGGSVSGDADAHAPYHQRPYCRGDVYAGACEAVGQGGAAAARGPVRHVEVHVDEPAELARLVSGMWAGEDGCGPLRGGCAAAGGAGASVAASRAGGGGDAHGGGRSTADAGAGAGAAVAPGGAPAASRPELASLRLATAAACPGWAPSGGLMHTHARLCAAVAAMLARAPVRVGCVCVCVPCVADQLLAPPEAPGGQPGPAGPWRGSAAAWGAEGAGAAAGAGPTSSTGPGAVHRTGAAGPGVGLGVGVGEAVGFEAVARAAAARGTRLCLGSLGNVQREGVVRALERAGVEVAEGRCAGCCSTAVLHSM